MNLSRITEPVRWALAALTLANIGIGLILIGVPGIGPVTNVTRDISGWVLIALAIPAALQCGYGLSHRRQEDVLIVNSAFLGIAAYNILTATTTSQLVATAGTFIVAVSACIGCILLWGHVSGRRLGEEYRKMRESARRGRS